MFNGARQNQFVIPWLILFQRKQFSQDLYINLMELPTNGVLRVDQSPIILGARYWPEKRMIGLHLNFKIFLDQKCFEWLLSKKSMLKFRSVSESRRSKN